MATVSPIQAFVASASIDLRTKDALTNKVIYLVRDTNVFLKVEC